MTDIDEILAGVRGDALPHELFTMDGAKLASVAQARASEARRGSALVAVGALVLGVAGSALPASPVEASPRAIGILTPLAPSVLLAG